MRIIGTVLSPYVMYAVLAARMKGLDIPIEPPEGGARSQEHLGLNPIGKVPVLLYTDFALPESATIAEFLEEELDGPSILPGNSEERARARLLARVTECYLGPAITPLLRAQPEPEAVAPALSAIRQALGWLESLRPLHGDWLAGDDHSVADCAAMPLFFYLEVLEKPHGTATILAEHPGLSAAWEHAKDSEHGLRMLQEMSAGVAAWRAAA
jgi:glutathione S-transferase